MLTAIFICLLLILALQALELGLRIANFIKKNPPAALRREEKENRMEKRKESLRVEKLMREVERYDGNIG